MAWIVLDLMHVAEDFYLFDVKSAKVLVLCEYITIRYNQ